MKKRIVFIVLAPLLLTGCWNIKEIQDINYVTALGLDYIDHRYVAYAQLIDLSSVAKTEGSRPEKPPPNWIGRGEGITVTEAVNNLYKDAQQKVFWGHVSTLVLSERILKQGIHDALDLINRYREIRYNILLLATKESIQDLFQAKPFFTLSSLSTLMHEPTEYFRQRSFIQPIRFFQFISAIREPGQTGYIPSLSLSSNHWKAEDKTKKLLQIDGAFFIRNNHLAGWLPESKLDGWRWINPKTVRSPLWITDGDKPIASLVIEKPKIRIEPIVNGESVYFQIHVKANGGVNEKFKDIPEKLLIHKAEEIMQKEIMKTFEEGVNIHADIYKLGLFLYHKHPKIWNNMTRGNSFFPTKDSVKKVNIQLRLIYSGKLKYEEN